MPMMELNRLGLTPIVVFNLVIWLFFTLAYFYQIVYIIRVMFKGTVRLPEAKKQHRYAFSWTPTTSSRATTSRS